MTDGLKHKINTDCQTNEQKIPYILLLHRHSVAPAHLKVCSTRQTGNITKTQQGALNELMLGNGGQRGERWSTSWRRRREFSF